MGETISEVELVDGMTEYSSSGLVSTRAEWYAAGIIRAEGYVKLGADDKRAGTGKTH